MVRSSGPLAAVALLAGAFFLSTASALIVDPLPLSDWSNGSSVFWGGPQDGQDDPYNMRLPPGACGYGELDSKMWPFFYVAGISAHNNLVRERPQASCGTCLEVRCAANDTKVCAGPAGTSITVMVTDECPQCHATELNLHAFAFEQIARLKYGSVAIQYRQVECSPADNMTVVVDGFRVSQGGWLRLSLKSVASDGGISRVELARSLDGAVGSNSTALPQPAPASAAGATAAGPNATASATPAAPAGAAAAATGAAAAPSSSTAAAARVWKVMDNTYGGEWEASALPSPPFDLRVTDLYGRKVLLRSVILKAGVLGEFPGHGQFPALSNATVAAFRNTVMLQDPLEVTMQDLPQPDQTSITTSSATATPTAQPAATLKAPPTAPPARTNTTAAAPKPLAAAATAVPKPVAAAVAAAAAAPKDVTPAAAPVRTTRRLHQLRRLQSQQQVEQQHQRRLHQGTRGQQRGPMP
ncbi:hypothetical protein HYH02_007019 [Chlamydomonas schloesseri]|uniref:Expansin-like EG45 domain-containing protein n=1 Tax=Chlamydomonas schloesseri TaxID=2026947 RepID=A0A835WIZ7_9CHLO|nr:hypothetical protein HYH02_007019 [Chlamydomonas schloesseri]|eukprot:KAG2447991.1 hypothetical protein HYH02_007019 [Chlamydomonas schloesseri]